MSIGSVSVPLMVAVYHVFNRAVGRTTLFDQPADYAAFEKVLRQLGSGRRRDIRPPVI
jgi:hypothetical protein